MVKHWEIRALIGAGLVACMMPPAMAQAAQSCAPRDQVVERLASTYGETRQSIGLDATNT